MMSYRTYRWLESSKIIALKIVKMHASYFDKKVQPQTLTDSYPTHISHLTSNKFYKFRQVAILFCRGDYVVRRAVRR